MPFFKAIPSNSVFPVSTKTTTYAVTSSDYFLKADASGGAFTITLPNAASVTGKEYVIQKIDSGFSSTAMVTIATTSSQTINGVTTTTLNTQYETLTVISDGSNWLAKRAIPSVETAFTPTGSWNTNVTYTGFWKRIGDNAQIDFLLTCTGVPGPSVNFTINIPSGMTMDTTKLTSTTTVVEILGAGHVNDGASQYRIIFQYSNTTTLAAVVQQVSTYVNEPSAVTINAPGSLGNTNKISGRVTVPITNWKG